MRKIVLLALVQGLALFVITGVLAYAARGDFWFRWLAPIFGLAAGIFRLFTALIAKSIAPGLYDKD